MSFGFSLDDANSFLKDVASIGKNVSSTATDLIGARTAVIAQRNLDQRSIAFTQTPSSPTDQLWQAIGLAQRTGGAQQTGMNWNAVLLFAVAGLVIWKIAK